FRVAELVTEGSGSRDLNPEMKALRLAVIAELEKAAAMARLETPYPMVDADYLPKILETYLDGFLGLSEAQIGEVHALALEVRGSHDLPEDASPRQVYELRNAVLSEFTELFDPSLSAKQREDFAKLDPIWSEIISGSHRRLTFGFQAEYGGTFLRELRTHYKLQTHHKDQAKYLADGYLDSVKQVYARYQVPDADISGLTTERRSALERDLYELELRLDEGLFGLLDAEERRAIVGQLPLVLRFQPGTSWDLSTDRAPGF
ncbi:MAG: hypothetical protein V3T77_09000, partial [Planctomycetota bacterium]